MSVTVDQIREKLRTDDRWLIRAILALNQRQTHDERADQTTKYHNEQGVRPAHARRVTGMAEFYHKTGYLTTRQIAWWRAITPSGRSRIDVYANQLAKIAQERSAA